MFLEYNAKNKTLSGTLLVCDTTHASGYIYPKDEVFKALQVYQSKIDGGTAFGVLGLDSAKVNLISRCVLKPEQVAVKLTKAYFDDNILMGVFDILYKTNDGGLLTALSNARFKFRAAVTCTGCLKNNVLHAITIHYFNIIKQ